MSKKDRLQELQFTVVGIQRRWGQRAIRPARQIIEARPPVLSTGLPDLDLALGIGGLPKGRVTELVTVGSSGQVFLVANTIRQVQRSGDAVVYVDLDHSLDLDALARYDVDFRRLFILRPCGLRHALTMIGDLLVEGGAALVVFDRLHPMLFTDPALALLDQALREWTPLLHSAMTVLLMITETIYLDWYPEGIGLPYFASVRLSCEQQQWLYQRHQVVGVLAEVRVLKNKFGSTGAIVPLEIPLI